MKGATSRRPSSVGIWNAYRTPGSSKLTLHPGPGWTFGCGPVGEGVRCSASSRRGAASIAASVSNWTNAFTARSKRGGGVVGRGVKEGGRGEEGKEGTGSVGVIGSRLGPMTSFGKWWRGGEGLGLDFPVFVQLVILVDERSAFRDGRRRKVKEGGEGDGWGRGEC